MGRVFTSRDDSVHGFDFAFHTCHLTPMLRNIACYLLNISLKCHSVLFIGCCRCMACIFCTVVVSFFTLPPFLLSLLLTFMFFLDGVSYIDGWLHLFYTGSCWNDPLWDGWWSVGTVEW